jgi:DNA-binding IclR family transcriptional regulator
MKLDRFVRAANRRAKVLALISKAGPEGLAPRHLVTAIGVCRDKVNYDLMGLKAEGLVMQAGVERNTSSWVLPEFIDAGQELAAKREAAATAAVVSACESDSSLLLGWQDWYRGVAGNR